MKKLDLYIFRQIFSGFLLALFSLMAIIWLSQSLRFLGFITNKGIGLLTFIELTSLLMPRIFTVLSPIVVFASVLFVYNKMLADRELVVIKAAGIAPTQMIKPALVFGFILMLFNLFVYNYGIGWAEKKFNELEWQVKNNISGLLLKPGEFTFLQKNLTIFVSSHNKDGSVEGVLINDERKEGSKNTVFAQFGRLVQNQNKPRIILVKGISQESNDAKKEFRATSFDRYSVDLGNPETVDKRRDSVRTLSFMDLWNAPHDKSIKPSEQSRRFAEANKRILSPCYNVLFALLGCLGLVIGGFNRRGQSKIITLSVVSMIFLQSLDLMFFSMATKKLALLPLMYINLIVPILLCVGFLFLYHPKKVKKNAAALFASFLLLLCAGNSHANVVAGAPVASKSFSPNAMLEPNKNITGFIDIKESDNQEEDIDFDADEVEYDKELATIIATGNVHVARNNLTVLAQKVIYNQKEDMITASGNVVLLEENGSVIFSDFVELTSKFSKAQMENVRVVMEDKTRLSAQRARKFDDNKKVLENATYSPCDVCSAKPDPLWQLKASKVTHNADTKDIHYNNAWLEVEGVPVFYMPFFSHPDPSVKRRSGFLAPAFGSSSYLGANIKPRYFWDIDEHQDFTFSPTLSSDKGIVYEGIYRKYLERGYGDITASFLRDDDLDKDRGSLFSKSRYEINDYWLFNSDINYASDRTYLKDMSLPKKDDPWLTSMVGIEGFNNRNYSAIEAYYYKTLSYELRDTNQPYVTPLFDYENYGDVGKYGAYVKTQFNAASVNRDEDDASTQRFSMINSWVLPYTSPYGEKYKMQASLKSDAYYVSDYVNADNVDYTGSVVRSFPQLGMEWRLPFVRSTATSRQILEPVVVGILAPNGGQKADEIPNEDSQDIRIDDTNILSLDRYAGYDRNDMGSRVSYGLNWSAYGEKTGRTAVFLAQSYNASKDTDFSDKNEDGYFSDYVGRAYAAPNDYLDLDYRFRADKDTLDLKYSELGTTFGPEILKMYVSYIYLAKNMNKNSHTLYYNDDRKEVYASVTAKLSRDWSLVLYNRQDMSMNSDKSLEHGTELIYEDECLQLTGYLRRVNSIDPTLENDLEFGVTFLLKTLGGAGTK